MNQYFDNNNNLVSNKNKISVIINNTNFIFYTDNGVFNKKGLDYGTRVLLENIKLDSKKTFLDVGCGCGPIGLFIAMQNSDYLVDMIDVNDRAISLCKDSIKDNNLNNIRIYNSDVYDNVNSKYDIIVTNPPIHAGKVKVYEIIDGAKEHLNNDGELWLVMRKDHGVKSMMKDFSNKYVIDVIKKDKGFYIIKGVLK